MTDLAPFPGDRAFWASARGICGECFKEDCPACGRCGCPEFRCHCHDGKNRHRHAKGRAVYFHQAGGHALLLLGATTTAFITFWLGLWVAAKAVGRAYLRCIAPAAYRERARHDRERARRAGIRQELVDASAGQRPPWEPAPERWHQTPQPSWVTTQDPSPADPTIYLQPKDPVRPLPKTLRRQG
jgi:hypothetical protein